MRGSVFENGRVPYSGHEKHSDVTKKIGMTASNRLKSTARSGLVEHVYHADDGTRQAGVVAKNEYVLKHFWRDGCGLHEDAEWIAEKERIGERRERRAAPFRQQPLDDGLLHRFPATIWSSLQLQPGKSSKATEQPANHPLLRLRQAVSDSADRRTRTTGGDLYGRNRVPDYFLRDINSRASLARFWLWSISEMTRLLRYDSCYAHKTIKHFVSLRHFRASHVIQVIGILGTPEDEFTRAIPELKGVHKRIWFGLENGYTSSSDPVLEGDATRWHRGWPGYRKNDIPQTLAQRAYELLAKYVLWMVSHHVSAMSLPNGYVVGRETLHMHQVTAHRRVYTETRIQRGKSTKVGREMRDVFVRVRANGWEGRGVRRLLRPV